MGGRQRTSIFFDVGGKEESQSTKSRAESEKERKEKGKEKKS
jgi:hypothetical protein